MAKQRFSRVRLVNAAKVGDLGGVRAELALVREDAQSRRAGLERSISQAAAAGQAQMVAYLLDVGACSDGSRDGERVLNSAFFQAASWGNAEIVEVLLERRAPKPALVSLALILASQNEEGLETARLLLDAGADPDAASGPDTPGAALVHATRLERPDMAELLLERGADVHVQGGRPLMRAVDFGREATVRLLLERGARLDALPEDFRLRADELLRGA